MATMDASQVTVGSAKVTGAVFVAPEGTALPTDATTALPSTFNLLGFTSDAGVTISESSSSESILAWEGRTEVYQVQTEYTEAIAFTPIQCNADVAKLLWGDDWVTVESNGNLHIMHHGGNLEPVVVVIESTPREGIVKRNCGTFKLNERGEQTMDGTQVDGRQVTLNAVADEDGVTMHEFIAFTS